MSDIIVPRDPNKQVLSSMPLWRYMDFIKFASLVEMKCLWFSRLGALQDQYEGIIPKPSYREMKQRDADVANWKEDFTWKAAASVMTEDNEISGRSILVVNCWNMNRTEDLRMWEKYTKDEFGVLVKTTFGRLRRAIPANPEFTIIGKVEYVDLAAHKMEMSRAHSASERALLKGLEYSHENEVRVSTLNIVAPYCLNPDGTPMTARQREGPGQFDENRPGLYIKVDLKTLVRLVIVSPKSPKWFMSLVKQMVKNHGLEIPVERSRYANQ